MRGAGSSQVSWVKDSFESSGILSARSRLFHCTKNSIRKAPETQRFQGFWRRSRDLNPGCDYSHYSLSRGAPSATWVLLQAEFHFQYGRAASALHYSSIFGSGCQLVFWLTPRAKCVISVPEQRRYVYALHIRTF